MQAKVVILGAGPTGLGAAWRFQKKNFQDWLVLESENYPGGLASSVKDEKGFVWDMGGHVLFSHYRYFDELMDELLPGQWVDHIRESWVWMRGRFIPYPLQNNIVRLPLRERLACLWGLWCSTQGDKSVPPATFQEWLLRGFGQGLYDSFLGPYNWKVWAYPPAQLNTQWMGERVATVDFKRVFKNVLLRKEDAGWGPNARFRFPLHGGTGAIWKALTATLPSEKIRFNSKVRSVRSGTRTLILADQTEVRYDRLITTMPLDRLLTIMEDLPELTPLAPQFRHSSSHIIGIGLEGQTPPHLKTKCWMYFPEKELPFYRVTVFSNYSPHNVPHPGKQWSLMAEVSESAEKPVDASTIAGKVVEGLVKAGLIPEGTPVVSLWHRRLEYGYPTPFMERESLLKKIQPELETRGIWSRGRFGGWRYEASNQDHSMAQGVEAADAYLENAVEETYYSPDKVNARR